MDTFKQACGFQINFTPKKPHNLSMKMRFEHYFFIKKKTTWPILVVEEDVKSPLIVGLIGSQLGIKVYID